MNGSRLLFLSAVIVFVLDAFGVKLGTVDLLPVGLALFVAGHLV